MCWAVSESEMIGGPGRIVEIDEAKFGRRKYHRGRFIEGQWLFGGIERGTKKLFYEQVPCRNEETLVALGEAWILPGTTIISDLWKAY